jgi:acetolactate synthase I/II/III large subunit
VPKLTGGQALVQSLKREGIDTIFCLPGVQLDWAFDALYDEQDHFRIYHTRHEQATAYMADGYARSTGKIGTSLVVPGPGLLNITAALSTAYACNSPVLAISGQIRSDLIGVGRGVLHEVPDQLEFMNSVTKWAGRAMKPEEVPGIVREAFRRLTSGRPRPVEIEIPPDVLEATGEVTLLEPGPEPVLAPDSDAIDRAAQALGRAERPLIFAGGGIIGGNASSELLRLAELLEAPVVMTSNGRGAVSDRHYLGQGPFAGKDLVPGADVVLAVGTRFVMPATLPWGVKPEQTVIQIDIDPEEVGRNYTPQIGIVSDARVSLTQLAERAQRYNRKRPSRKEELTALKARLTEQLNSVHPQSDFGNVLRDELPDDGILVSEMTQVGYWSNQGFPVYQPRTYITPGYQGTLGYGFATALGVKAGNPNKKVVSINGDGGFMYTVQELSTMVRHGINLVTVVFNDNAYGNVRRIQTEQFNGRTIASDLLNPDFVKLVESFGIEGRRAKGPEGLRSALRESLAADRPVLIEVPVEMMPNMQRLTGPMNNPPPRP